MLDVLLLNFDLVLCMVLLLVFDLFRLVLYNLLRIFLLCSLILVYFLYYDVVPYICMVLALLILLIFLVLLLPILYLVLILILQNSPVDISLVLYVLVLLLGLPLWSCLCGLVYMVFRILLLFLLCRLLLFLICLLLYNIYWNLLMSYLLYYLVLMGLILRTLCSVIMWAIVNPANMNGIM